jgi:GR25 family glycosyltransferase involved in LPS biosynthesis
MNLNLFHSVGFVTEIGLVSKTSTVERLGGLLIPAYVIGKEGNYRNPRLLEELQPTFLVMEKNGFVDASTVDLASSLDLEAFRTTTGREPLLTEVACGLAHIRAWRFLVSSEREELAVFEDDVYLASDDDTLKRLPNILKHLKGNWQLNLETRPGDWLITHLIGKAASVRGSRVPPRGAGAYIISRHAAIRALGALARNTITEKLDGPIDHSIALSRVIKYWIATPPIFKVKSDVVSLIEDKAGSRKQRKIRFTLMGAFARHLKVIRMSLSFRSPLSSGLVWVRPLKYLLSVHFLTSWFKLRFRKKSGFLST